MSPTFYTDSLYCIFLLWYFVCVRWARAFKQHNFSAGAVTAPRSNCTTFVISKQTQSDTFITRDDSASQWKSGKFDPRSLKNSRTDRQLNLHGWLRRGPLPLQNFITNSNMGSPATPIYRSWRGHLTYFWNFGTPSISRERLELETSKFGMHIDHQGHWRKKCKVISSSVIFAVLDLRVGGCRPQIAL